MIQPSLDAFTLTPAPPRNLPAVAQVGNLLYRRLVVGWLQNGRNAADCQSATQQTTSLRYGSRVQRAFKVRKIIPLRERENRPPVFLNCGCRRLLGRLGSSDERHLLSPTHEPFVPPQGLGVRQSSGAFDSPRLPQRQRTGALQDAGAIQLGLFRFRGPNRGCSRAGESLPGGEGRGEGERLEQKATPEHL